MKLSDLMEQLTYLNEHYGDLECVVNSASGIDTVERVQLYVLQDFDFGNMGALRTGDRVALVWSKS